MKTISIEKSRGLRGAITPPPDKSISHRAVMFGALADGVSVVRNFLRAEDPLSTIACFRRLGIEIREEPSGDVVISGKGIHGLTEAADVIDCGNSGTTMRLISGILAGNPFFSVLTGDGSLRQRPMARVITPLRGMGARISARANDRYPPLAIQGGPLKAMDYIMPMASAQVKSCVLLAGLYADGTTTVTEPRKSRDHTERMLAAMGAAIAVNGLSVSVTGGGRLGACDVTVPADFSSAAFFIAAALMVPGSEVVIKNVCMNGTRTGMLEVIGKMGGLVAIESRRDVSGEPVADLRVTAAAGLKAVSIGPDIMPALIDEFPILCILATQAHGVTEIRGAEELRVKESDRISAMAVELRKLGAVLEEYPDGIAITGPVALNGASVDSYGDHRIAMALSVAALVSRSPITVNDASCADVSFPGFYEALRGLEA